MGQIRKKAPPTPKKKKKKIQCVALEIPPLKAHESDPSAGIT